jgi:hypothetical protein
MTNGWKNSQGALVANRSLWNKLLDLSNVQAREPPPWKGAFKGSSYESASSRHVGQLASSRGTNGLSGNASPLDTIQFRVKTPSNQRHTSAAGCSQGQSGTHPVRSWRHTSGRRSRVNGYVRVNLSPFPNLGRNLFPSGVFLRSTKAAGSMAQGGRVGLKGAAPSALRALVR